MILSFALPHHDADLPLVQVATPQQQHETMEEVLDEKQGPPVMEIDEPYSVAERSLLYLYR